MYKFRSYLIQEINCGYVLQNGVTTVVITNAKLIEFLKDIEIKGIIDIEEQDFLDVFGDEFRSVIKFLIDNKVIVKCEKPNLNFDKIYLFTNNLNISNVVNYCIEDFEEEVINVSIENCEEKINNINKNSLCIIFLNPFNLKEYISLCNKLIETNAIIRSSFFYNHSIYISNFYRKAWYNPCPKCFFYALESQLRATLPSNTISFQTLIDLIYKENSKFNIVTNLKKIDSIAIVTLLLKDIKFKNDLTNINNIYEFELETYSIIEDSAYHWELCDCYE